MGSLVDLTHSSCDPRVIEKKGPIVGHKGDPRWATFFISFFIFFIIIIIIIFLFLNKGKFEILKKFWGINVLLPVLPSNLTPISNRRGGNSKNTKSKY